MSVNCIESTNWTLNNLTDESILFYYPTTFTNTNLVIWFSLSVVRVNFEKLNLYNSYMVDLLVQGYKKKVSIGPAGSIRCLPGEDLSTYNPSGLPGPYSLYKLISVIIK